MLIQVGVYPPPIGGVTIYIKRMKDFLNSKGIENQVWDYSNVKKSLDDVININFFSVPFRYALKSDSDLIHYNMGRRETKYFIGFFNRFFFKKRKKLLTIHGDCSYLFKKYKKLMIKSLNSFDAIICVRIGDKEYLISQGVTPPIYEIPAFIPPLIKKEDIDEIPQKVWNFIDNHKPIISANASKIAFHNGQDLYGIDMSIELCTRIKIDYPQIGFILFIPEIKNNNYLHTMQERIINNDLKDNFLFYTNPSQFYPILMKSDIFVRPTNIDGDAVSIREALWIKIPTVASDVVSRPEGTILFRNRNIEDFSLMVKRVLNDKKQQKKQLEIIHMDNNAEKIMEIYKKFMN